MLSRTGLFRSDVVHIRHVACRAGCGPAGDIEYPAQDGIVLPVRGVFTLHVTPDTQVLVEPLHALLFAGDRPYRISHPAHGGDECLVLEFAPDLLHEALADAAGADRLADRRLRPHALLAPLTFITRDVLHRQLRHGNADRLHVEGSAAALLRNTLQAARQDVGHSGSRAGAATRARRRDQVEAVRLHILRDPGSCAGLGELARVANTTSWHLARVFAAEVGVSLHRYRTRTRVAAAIPRLLETDVAAARIGFELGFSSQSHFTETFRRLTGWTPGALRRNARGQHVSRLSRILIEPPSSPQ